MLLFDPTTDASQFTLRRLLFVPAWSAYVVYKQQHAILYAEQPLHFLKLLWAWCAAIGSGILIVVIAFTINRQLSSGTGQALIMLCAIFGCVIAIFTVGLTQSPPKHLIFWRDEARFDMFFEVIQRKRWGFPQRTYSIRDQSRQLIGSVTNDTVAWHGYDHLGSLVATAVSPPQPLAKVWFLLGVFIPLAHLIGAARLRSKLDLLRHGQRIATVKRSAKTTTIDLVNPVNASLDRRILLVLSLLA
jgi:hypothetical protein